MNIIDLEKRVKANKEKWIGRKFKNITPPCYLWNTKGDIVKEFEISLFGELVDSDNNFVLYCGHTEVEEIPREVDFLTAISDLNNEIMSCVEDSLLNAKYYTVRKIYGYFYNLKSEDIEEYDNCVNSKWLIKPTSDKEDK